MSDQDHIIEGHAGPTSSNLVGHRTSWGSMTNRHLISLSWRWDASAPINEPIKLFIIGDVEWSFTLLIQSERVSLPVIAVGSWLEGVLKFFWVFYITFKCFQGPQCGWIIGCTWFWCSKCPMKDLQNNQPLCSLLIYGYIGTYGKR